MSCLSFSPTTHWIGLNLNYLCPAEFQTSVNLRLRRENGRSERETQSSIMTQRLTKIQNFHKLHLWGLTVEKWCLFITLQKLYIRFDETILNSKANQYHINNLSQSVASRFNHPLELTAKVCSFVFTRSHGLSVLRVTSRKQNLHQSVV